MRILLDTHILLWAAAGTLTAKAAHYVEDESNVLLFSPASIWEIGIKHGLSREDFKVDPASLYSGLISAGYEELRIHGRHALMASALPQFHKDPFDRMLIAQAASEGVPLVTADDVVAKYPG